MKAIHQGESFLSTEVYSIDGEGVDRWKTYLEDSDAITELCFNLIIFDNTTGVFRLAHTPVQEFLLGYDNGYYASDSHNHARLAEHCISLLLLRADLTGRLWSTESYTEHVSDQPAEAGYSLRRVLLINHCGTLLMFYGAERQQMSRLSFGSENGGRTSYVTAMNIARETPCRGSNWSSANLSLRDRGVHPQIFRARTPMD